MIPTPYFRNLKIIQNIPEAETILVAGCGEGKLDEFLLQKYDVLSLDIKNPENDNINFVQKDLTTDCLNQAFDCVIASEVLEHINEYKKVFKYLLAHTIKSLIITVPWKTSYNDPDHTNYWCWGIPGEGAPVIESQHSAYKKIDEFVDLAFPNEVNIETFPSTERDKVKNEKFFLIVVEKKCTIVI